ncbi:MAG: ATP-binding protein [Hyphomonadaceae bacterium]
MLKLQIRHKIFLAIFITVGLVVAGVMVSQRNIFERSFLSYTAASASERLGPLSELLAERYIENDGWSFIAGEEQWNREYVRAVAPFFRASMNQEGIDAPAASPFRGPYGGARSRDLRLGQPRRGLRQAFSSLSLIDIDGNWVAGAPLSANYVQLDIIVDDKIVGALKVAIPTSMLSDLDLAFLNQQRRMIWTSGLLALTMAAMAAFLLSRNFAKPIQELARSVSSLANGLYGVRIQSTRTDELGRLAEDVNSLAQTLEDSRAAQRAWVADTSHELRTPITILLAELEAIQDGVRPLDDEALNSFSSELTHLRVLVDDLHQLAKSDSGNLLIDMQMLDFGELISTCTEAFRSSFTGRQINLLLDITQGGDTSDLANLYCLSGDADRLRQVINNLLDNALRYADAKGKIRVALENLNNGIELTIEDSGPGVPEAALPKLFDRFFRVDPSRNRQTGSSGLGLSICETIVRAHSGTIQAEHSLLGGLRITVFLPVK